jgi:hypothetical protein
MLQWESTNELNAFRLLDCDPRVTSFNEQPCEIKYVLDGVTHSHFPDILVEFDGQKHFWEVKPERQALLGLREQEKDAEIAARTALLAVQLPRYGYAYRIVLGNDLAIQPRLSNAVQLLHFGYGAVSECEQEFIRRALKKYGALVWADVRDGVYGARGREIVCRLTLTGNLTLDMNSVWTPDTRFILGKAGL